MSLIMIAMCGSACSKTALPVYIDSIADNTFAEIDQIEKNSEFRLYKHSQGYLLLASLADSSEDIKDLLNKNGFQQKEVIDKALSIALNKINARKYAIELSEYTIDEDRPIMIGKENIIGRIAEIKNKNDQYYREAVFFLMDDSPYCIYYFSQVKNDLFYTAVKGVKKPDSDLVQPQHIDVDFRLMCDLDLGTDSKGNPYFLIYKKKNESAGGARRQENQENHAIAVVTIRSNSIELEEATVDISLAHDKNIYRNNANAYFDLQPEEVCEYSIYVPLPFKPDPYDCLDLEKEMEVKVSYRSGGKEVSVTRTKNAD